MAVLSAVLNKLSSLKLYLILFLIGILIFFVLQRLLNFGFYENLFFQGIWNLILSALLLYGLSELALRQGMRLKRTSICHTCFYFVCLMTLFWTHIPVTYERSVTVHLLQELKSNKELTQEELSTFLHNDYIDANGALEKRLSEQVEIGNIESINGLYRITEKGDSTLCWMRALSGFFVTLPAEYPMSAGQ